MYYYVDCNDIHIVNTLKLAMTEHKLHIFHSVQIPTLSAPQILVSSLY